MAEDAVRTVSPFGIGTAPADEPVAFGPEVDEVTVEIIGNSYHPKVVEVAPGTKVTWRNEEVFTYMQGEFSGIHNAFGTSGPEQFSTRLLAHGETASHTFTEPGTYDYICTPHPYMEGRIIVREPAQEVAAAGGDPAPEVKRAGAPGWLVGLVVLALAVAVLALVVPRRSQPAA